MAESYLGGSAVPFRATLFFKSRSANWLVVWHQDTALPLQSRFEAAGWGPWSVKAGILYAHAPADALSQVVALRLHLDSSTEANGPLRVIPHSHTSGVLTDQAIAELVRAADPVSCIAGLGSVVAMRPLIVHSSSKSTSSEPRRILHIEYASSLTPEPGATLAVA
jgi:ectoine hydroxylase-related dioxygenase (phytanoyl-CoA dioxygenase family)